MYIGILVAEKRKVDDYVQLQPSVLKKVRAEEMLPVLSEKQILMELFNATTGPKWRVGKHWGTDKPLKKWKGVHVNIRGEVTELKLPRNKLDGILS